MFKAARKGVYVQGGEKIYHDGLTASQRWRKRLKQAGMKPPVHNNPYRARRWKLLKKYGLTIEQYQEILVYQDGVCAICKQHETGKVHGKIRELSVDHNHITGKVRGLLCARCNPAISLLGDDPGRLREAALYLEKHDE